MKQILLVILAILSFSASYAKNIQPVENVGRILVQLPDLSSFPKALQDEFKGRYQSLSFRNKVIQPGVEYFVDAGEGCATLNLTNGYVYAAEFCGVVSPGQLTTLQYIAFHIDWNQASLQTDVGPAADFFLHTDDGSTFSYTSTAFSSLSYARNYLSHNLHIGRPGNYKGVFKVAGTNDVIDEKMFTISTLQTVDVTPKDVREELTVEFLNGPGKFSIPGSSGAYVIFRSQPFTAANKTLKPAPLIGSSYGNVVNSVTLNHSTPVHHLKYFPVTKQEGTLSYHWVLEVVANETRWPLSFEKGQKQHVPIEIINVHDFQTGKPGEFNFSRKDTMLDGTQKWTPILAANSTGGDLYPQSLPTSRTLLLLPGYEYRFEFFIRDDLGKLFKQDEKILDLK